jgi:hypothetical protein
MYTQLNDIGKFALENWTDAADAGWVEAIIDLLAAVIRQE